MSTLSTAELLVSSCAVIIACCALYVSVRQGQATIRHNKLSVKPHLHYSARNISSGEPFQLRVKNAGVGPAIIVDMRVTLDGREIEEADPLLHFIAKARADKVFVPGDELVTATSWLNGDVPLMPGEDFLLLELGKEGNISDDELSVIRNRLIDVMNRLNVLVKYQSIYGPDDKDFYENLQDSWDWAA